MRNFYSYFFDFLLVTLSFFLSLYFSIEDVVNRQNIIYLFISYYILYVFCFLIFNFWFKNGYVIYKFFSSKDFIELSKTIIFFNFSFILIIFLYDRLENIPRINLIYNIIFSSVLLNLVRMVPRIVYFRKFEKKNKLKRTIIIGEELECYKFIKFNEAKDELKIIGIISINNKLKGSIRGINILGNLKHLIKILKNNSININQILIISNVEKEDLSEIYSLTANHNINIFNAKFEITDNSKSNLLLSKINIENFLSRPIKLIEDSYYYQFYKNKVIFITGCGGSIGSQLVKEVLKYEPQKVYGCDISEGNIFKINQEISKNNLRDKCKFFLADINNFKKIENLIKKIQPKIIIHAAALKHVSISEENCDEVINTNIFGTKKILKTLEKNESIENFIFVSTDKAVYPISMMGITKFLAENICRIFANKFLNKKFILVRFGNVLASSGSVVPIFEKQIKDNGPVTVSHKEVDRYFMLINEACSLILLSAAYHALSEKSNVNTFMLDMGKPVKILDLAKKMIALSSNNKNDIQIKITGLKKGEKLSEELYYNYEKPKKLEKFPIFKLKETNIPESFEEKLIKLNEDLTEKEINLNILRENTENLCEKIIKKNEI